ncbi:MAG: YggT family protein [Chloroflexi bacterium]|nr:YggT family protein [Chloroflexota bacterium]
MGFLFNFIQLLCQVLTTLILARVVLSWFSPAPTNAVARTLHQITEPVMWPIRRVLPKTGMIDLTPLVTVILLQVIAFVLP